MRSRLGVLVLAVFILETSFAEQTSHAACPAPFKLDSPGVPADTDRYGALFYLAKRIPGIDTRNLKSSDWERRLGLWYGIWFQTNFQLRTGRNFFPCWDGSTTTAPAGYTPNSKWLDVNYALTLLPYKFYRRHFEGKSIRIPAQIVPACAAGPAPGKTYSTPDLARCKKWLAFFLAAAKYKTDVESGEIGSWHQGLTRSSRECDNQKFLWIAHSSSVDLNKKAAVASTIEDRFILGWTWIVKHILETASFPTTKRWLSVFGQVMPRCGPLGAWNCVVAPDSYLPGADPAHGYGLPRVQYLFAKMAIKIYDQVKGLTHTLLAQKVRTYLKEVLGSAIDWASGNLCALIPY
ncbi:MAG: hypothetical protein HYY84_16350 [Deltaproteobacteria bacterium]|nr:hypothetical protein [Deltaproteobacteria bacterium]